MHHEPMYTKLYVVFVHPQNRHILYFNDEQVASRTFKILHDHNFQNVVYETQYWYDHAQLPNTTTAIDRHGRRLIADKAELNTLATKNSIAFSRLDSVAMLVQLNEDPRHPRTMWTNLLDKNPNNKNVNKYDVHVKRLEHDDMYLVTPAMKQRAWQAV